MEPTFKDLVGKKTAPGFDLCDTRNDKADCVREIRAEFSPDFHGKQLLCSFRASQSQIDAQLGSPACD